MCSFCHLGNYLGKFLLLGIKKYCSRLLITVSTQCKKPKLPSFKASKANFSLVTRYIQIDTNRSCRCGMKFISESEKRFKYALSYMVITTKQDRIWLRCAAEVRENCMILHLRFSTISFHFSRQYDIKPTGLLKCAKWQGSSAPLKLLKL